MFGLFEKRKEAVQQKKVDEHCKKKRSDLENVFDMDRDTTTDLNKMLEQLTRKNGTEHR
jgi:hypothetical protein